MTTGWLRAALFLEAVLFVLFVALLAVEVVVTRSRSRSTAAVREARDCAVRAMQEGGDVDKAAVLMAAIPRARAMSLVVQLADAVSGTGLDRLRLLAERAGLTDQALAWCGSRAWARRLRGIRLLTRLQTVRDAEVLHLLEDPVGAVAAAAADSVGPSSTAPAFDRLLLMLGDHRPECRFAAKVALSASGMAAAPALTRYLQDPGCPRAADALEAATQGPAPQLMPVAEQWSTHPDAMVRARAATLVGAIGGRHAAATLGAMLSDSDPQVRSAAALGLGRLGEWGAGNAVARLMDDPDWNVRRSSALALVAMGAPGRLYLRRAAGGVAGCSADAARHVLDLPSGATETVLT